MSNNQPQMPQPDSALKKLEPLVGSWKLKGHLISSSEENITGKATFEWLSGGYFLQQTIELNFMGMTIKSREIISYNPEALSLPGGLLPLANEAGCPTLSLVR